MKWNCVVTVFGKKSKLSIYGEFLFSKIIVLFTFRQMHSYIIINENSLKRALSAKEDKMFMAHMNSTHKPNWIWLSRIYCLLIYIWNFGVDFFMCWINTRRRILIHVMCDEFFLYFLAKIRRRNIITKKYYLALSAKCIPFAITLCITLKNYVRQQSRLFFVPYAIHFNIFSTSFSFSYYFIVLILGEFFFFFNSECVCVYELFFFD